MEIMKRAEIANRTDQRKVEGPFRIADNDRLSSLPDELISHILCSLETKYAVGTAVLSRRWKDLWTGVSHLDFDNGLLFTTDKDLWEEDPSEEQRRSSEFCRFIDRVMSRHENLKSLRCFRLLSSDYRLSPDFWSRMQSAVSGSELLEEIDVTKGAYTAIYVHNWLPTLKNLKVLKLDRVNIETSTTSVILLPSLKILQLLEVEVTGCGRLNKVISGCPALETLLVQRCYSHREEDMLDIIVSLPSLKSLKIIGWSCEDSDPANPLHHMVIEAPRLEHLWLEDFAGLQLLGNIRSSSSPVLQCLDSAHVDVFARLDEDDQEYAQHRPVIIGFLTQISNARDIKLSSPILDVLSDFRDIQLPLFPNLTSLAIEADGGRVQGLYRLLNSAASSLQSLFIGLDRWGIRDPAADASKLECLFPSLEEIEIHFGRYIKEAEVEVVSDLFKAAVGAVLKRVNMHSNSHLKCDFERGASLLKLAKESCSVCEAHLFLTDYVNGKEVRLHIQDPEDVPCLEDMDDDDTVDLQPQILR